MTQKKTIELVKKLSDNDKVRPLHPDQIFGSDDTSLFMHTCDSKNKKTMENNR